ncbi:mitogen-activated protein kinase kinase kinase 1 [Capsaspora owczarzaki ATCC 30864]|uniref:mitogen-activated protein kinase kinase kinase 1 n=1 Tax=Capsaspora owczarzaki (strain ATCC 30864) TaxID=595528 RepID=UPI0001FE4590|nr:mitogen-activated protein kinase kinase kinase 1 [Capsaspora owczarzaki ATCC 30864]|eukprot:XP_004347387.1 mitogen-activated protein kinase kinase kinase 1 [Capsaspora owczarzaki ATCC 30864]
MSCAELRTKAAEEAAPMLLLLLLLLDCLVVLTALLLLLLVLTMSLRQVFFTAASSAPETPASASSGSETPALAPLGDAASSPSAVAAVSAAGVAAVHSASILLEGFPLKRARNPALSTVVPSSAASTMGELLDNYFEIEISHLEAQWALFIGVREGPPPLVNERCCGVPVIVPSYAEDEGKEKEKEKEQRVPDAESRDNPIPAILPSPSACFRMAPGTHGVLSFDGSYISTGALEIADSSEIALPLLHSGSVLTTAAAVVTSSAASSAAASVDSQPPFPLPPQHQVQSPAFLPSNKQLSPDCPQLLASPLQVIASDYCARPLRSGDIVGCGVSRESQQLFFSLNGEALGCVRIAESAATAASSLTAWLYPILSVMPHSSAAAAASVAPSTNHTLACHDGVSESVVCAVRLVAGPLFCYRCVPSQYKMVRASQRSFTALLPLSSDPTVLSSTWLPSFLMRSLTRQCDLHPDTPNHLVTVSSATAPDLSSRSLWLGLGADKIASLLSDLRLKGPLPAMLHPERLAVAPAVLRGSSFIMPWRIYRGFAYFECTLTDTFNTNDPDLQLGIGVTSNSSRFSGLTIAYSSLGTLLTRSGLETGHEETEQSPSLSFRRPRAASHAPRVAAESLLPRARSPQDPPLASSSTPIQPSSAAMSVDTAGAPPTFPLQKSPSPSVLLPAGTSTGSLFAPASTAAGGSAFAVRRFSDEQYTNGDTIGCGMSFEAKEIFFTKNGALVGTVPCPKIDGETAGMLRPCVFFLRSIECASSGSPAAAAGGDSSTANATANTTTPNPLPTTPGRDPGATLAALSVCISVTPPYLFHIERHLQRNDFDSFLHSDDVSLDPERVILSYPCVTAGDVALAATALSCRALIATADEPWQAPPLSTSLPTSAPTPATRTRSWSASTPNSGPSSVTTTTTSAEGGSRNPSFGLSGSSSPHPLPTPSRFAYFEVTILDSARGVSCSAPISIGLALPDHPLDSLPGTTPYSFSFNAADGNLMFNAPFSRPPSPTSLRTGATFDAFALPSETDNPSDPMPTNEQHLAVDKFFGPTCSQGDIVGCGIDRQDSSIFFTRNGKLLGKAFSQVDFELLSHLRAAVGFHSLQSKIRINFGSRGLLFDPLQRGAELSECTADISMAGISFTKKLQLFKQLAANSSLGFWLAPTLSAPLDRASPKRQSSEAALRATIGIAPTAPAAPGSAAGSPALGGGIGGPTPPATIQRSDDPFAISPPGTFDSSKRNAHTQVVHGDVSLVHCVAGTAISSTVPSFARSASSDDHPSARSSHAAAVWRGQLVVHGGYHSTRRSLDDTWLLNLATKTWSRIPISTSSPTSRYSHSAVILQDRYFVIFGGMTDQGVILTDLRVLDLEKREWLWVESAGPGPSPRMEHMAVEYKNAMYVFGGSSMPDKKDHYASGMFRATFANSTITWTELPVERVPQVCSASACVFGQAIWVFGGASGNPMTATSTMQSFSFASQMWSTLNTNGTVPEPRMRHSACLVTGPQITAWSLYQHSLLLGKLGISASDTNHSAPPTPTTGGPGLFRKFSLIEPAALFTAGMLVVGGRSTHSDVLSAAIFEFANRSWRTVLLSDEADLTKPLVGQPVATGATGNDIGAVALFPTPLSLSVAPRARPLLAPDAPVSEMPSSVSLTDTQPSSTSAPVSWSDNLSVLESARSTEAPVGDASALPSKSVASAALDRRSASMFCITGAGGVGGVFVWGGVSVASTRDVWDPADLLKIKLWDSDHVETLRQSVLFPKAADESPVAPPTADTLGDTTAAWIEGAAVGVLQYAPNQLLASVAPRVPDDSSVISGSPPVSDLVVGNNVGRPVIGMPAPLEPAFGTSAMQSAPRLSTPGAQVGEASLVPSPSLVLQNLVSPALSSASSGPPGLPQRQLLILLEFKESKEPPHRYNITCGSLEDLLNELSQRLQRTVLPEHLSVHDPDFDMYVRLTDFTAIPTKARMQVQGSAPSPLALAQSPGSVLSGLLSPDLATAAEPAHAGTARDVDVPAPSACPLAKTFRWSRGELLGKGAVGRVYKGINEETGQFIAVKEVAMAPGEASKVLEALENEIRLLSQLQHPHVVQYFGVETTNDCTANIFMEFCPGGSIATILRSFGPLPETLIALYTKQILFGLEYLHSKNVIHRDIKGANLLVDANGRIKLADFGTARKFEELGTVSKFSFVGTPFWMAPEVIQNRPQTSKVDIFSVGCTIYEMATSHPPFSTLETTQAIFRIGTLKRMIPIPAEVVLSATAVDFYDSCTQINPEERQSASVLLHHPFLKDVAAL